MFASVLVMVLMVMVVCVKGSLSKGSRRTGNAEGGSDRWQGCTGIYAIIVGKGKAVGAGCVVGVEAQKGDEERGDGVAGKLHNFSLPVGFGVAVGDDMYGRVELYIVWGCRCSYVTSCYDLTQ